MSLPVKEGRILPFAAAVDESARFPVEGYQALVEAQLVGIAGVAARRKRPPTTVPAPSGQPRPSDLLQRDFTAAAPARRCVADITYVDTARGFV